MGNKELEIGEARIFLSPHALWRLDQRLFGDGDILNVCRRLNEVKAGYISKKKNEEDIYLLALEGMPRNFILILKKLDDGGETSVEKYVALTAEWTSRYISNSRKVRVSFSYYTELKTDLKNAVRE